MSGRSWGFLLPIKKRQKFYLHKWNFRSKIYFVVRRVAQFGRALRSGRRGRGFESRHADIRFFLSRERAFFYIKKLNGCKEDKEKCQRTLDTNTMRTILDIFKIICYT